MKRRFTVSCDVNVLSPRVVTKKQRWNLSESREVEGSAARQRHLPERHIVWSYPNSPINKTYGQITTGAAHTCWGGALTLIRTPHCTACPVVCMYLDMSPCPKSGVSDSHCPCLLHLLQWLLRLPQGNLLRTPPLYPGHRISKALCVDKTLK